MLRRAWNTFWFTGFSVESLGLLRIFLGFGLFFFHFTQFWSLFLVEPSGAHFYFLQPLWYFELLGIERNSPETAYVGFAVLQLATLSLALGYRTRLSIIVVLLIIFYLKGVRDSFAGGNYAGVHHRYLVPAQILFFLLLSKCGEAYSLDARRRKRAHAGDEPVEEWQASWPIKAMQVYCASFYFWSAIAKLRMSGWAWFFDPQRIQELLLSRSLMFGATASGEPAFNALPYWLAQQETLCQILGLATLVMEAGFPLILFLRSPRARFVFLLGVSFFHVANAVLAYVVFLLFPIVFLVFFDLEDVRRRLVGWWRARRRAQRYAAAVPPRSS